MQDVHACFIMHKTSQESGEKKGQSADNDEALFPGRGCNSQSHPYRDFHAKDGVT